MDYRLPELGEGVYEAELVQWHVKPGEAVKRGHILMEVLTDKATMEVPASFSGTISLLRAQSGQQIKVGDVVLTYTETTAAEKAPKTEKPAAPAIAEARPSPKSLPAARAEATAVKAAPSVRLMARKLGVDLGQVRGSGPGGRVLVDDLIAVKGSDGASAKPQVRAPLLNFGTPGTRLKFAGLRRKIAEHLVHAKKTIPHYSYMDECDVTELVRLRDSLREPFSRLGLKLTYVAFFVKAVVGALKEVPIVNASLDEQAEEIGLHDCYHIGVATATPNGLIVPVLHDADKKDLPQIAREVERLGAEARSGKITREDLRGGTFTITSIGGIGGLISTPIIHHPEVGILGIGKVVKRPVYDAAGNIRPADIVYLSFSFDHRIVDGAVGAAFGNAVIRRLANPAAFLVPEKLG